MVKSILQEAPSGSQQERLLHTGAFLSDLGGTRRWKDADRKLRLGILSALATQDHGHTKLIFWTDVPSNHSLLQKALAPILQDAKLSHRLSVKTFDANSEFGKIAPHSGDVLLQLYQTDTMLASRSDLFRTAILHNYGGMWVDTDVLLIRDFAPLLGEDFAYLGQPNFINNAVLSVSRSRSPFIQAYLATVAAHGLGAASNGSIYKFGPALLGEIWNGGEQLKSNGSFHVLPTCFFDGGWSGEHGAVSWDDFFSKNATHEEVDYVSPQGSSQNTFAYHWHGRWERPIVDGSLAALMELRYSQQLGLAGAAAKA
jgi:hypothetical protein